LFPVPALKKPADVLCEHANASGCALHGQGRPPVCGEYDCYWREHEDMAEEFRPDRIGIVVTEAGTVAVGGKELGVLLWNQTDPEARRSRDAQSLLDGVVAKGMVAMVLCGQDLEIVFDRAQYPAIAARDIEVAFRYEQSQDADELKRLGAVPDDYRSLTWGEAEALVPR
jgi:hypothetical protein